MPVKVLSRHGVIETDGKLVSLMVPALTLEQQAHVRMLCEQRLQTFVRKRGLGIWDYRLLETEPIPDSLRYQALKASGGRCTLCGVTRNKRPIDVDHIIPRSRGGKNELANLQALCAKCNRSKRDQDATDFRLPIVESDPACPFCDGALVKDAVDRNGSAIAVMDKHPVTPGHLLVIPVRHVADVFGMTASERGDADDLIRVLRARIMLQDPKVVGFNIGSNCGESAGHTILHAHIHLIPRRKGDMADPRGGVRGVIPERQSYPPSDWRVG